MVSKSVRRDYHVGAYHLHLHHRVWTHDRNLPCNLHRAHSYGDHDEPRRGQTGQNYLRGLLALGFQAFLIIVCVAIYAVLVQNIAIGSDISYAIWTCMGYTVLLCFTLFKSSSLAKSIFHAH